MSITFFCVGAVIFATYMYFTIRNIYNPQTKSKRKDYLNLGSEGCDLPSEYFQHNSVKKYKLKRDKYKGIRIIK